MILKNQLKGHKNDIDGHDVTSLVRYIFNYIPIRMCTFDEFMLLFPVLLQYVLNRLFFCPRNLSECFVSYKGYKTKCITSININYTFVLYLIKVPINYIIN